MGHEEVNRMTNQQINRLYKILKPSDKKKFNQIKEKDQKKAINLLTEVFIFIGGQNG